MADGDKTAEGGRGDQFSSKGSPPETQIGDGDHMSLDMGDSPDTRKVQHRAPGVGTEVGTGKANEDNEDLGLTDEEKSLLTGEEGDGITGDEEADGDKGGEAPEPLPAFDPKKPDVVEAYEAAYVNEGGDLNTDALGEQWYANARDPKTGQVDLSKGGLSEDTYKWLGTKGFSKEFVKTQEKAILALQTQRANEVFTAAGGQDQYAAAIQWAREGGYNPQARAAFNAAVNGQDDQARLDAVEVLMNRHRKANPQGRRASPRKSTQQGGAGGQGGVVGYESYADWQKDVREAREAKDQKKLDQSRIRLKASSWYKGGKA